MRFTAVRFASTLVFAACAAAPAVAQDSGGLRPLRPGQPIEDLGGWLGDEGVPEADPLAPDPLAPGPAPEAQPELDPAERRKRERQIDHNYDEAQKTYREIIGADPVGPLDRRIANNERLVKEYTGKIRDAHRERRQIQVDLFNRSFFLKQQLERKQITEEAYGRLISEEERKYEERTQQLDRDLESWNLEVGGAQKRLEDLKAERRMLVASNPRPRTKRGQPSGPGGRPAPKPRPGERLIGTLQERLQRLGRFQTRHTLDGVHPRELAGGLGAGASAGAADLNRSDVRPAPFEAEPFEAEPRGSGYGEGGGYDGGGYGSEY